MSTSFSSSAAEAATAFEVNGDWLLADPGVVPAQAGVRVSAVDGRFNAITPVALPAGRARRLLLPALANAHDHARHFRSSTLGATGQPLETWLPFLGTVSALDPYLCAATSFARSVRKGVTHLMVHYTTVQGGMPYVDEARAVARAARDVGVRIGFAVAMRDRNGIAYTLDGDDAPVLAALRPGIRDAVAGRLKVRPVALAAQLALVDEVAAMVDAEGFGEHVTVQYGPTAVQWCSPALLQAIAQASADTGRPVHMHLLETRIQREWADRMHPQGIVRYLDDIGLLSPRLTLAHCAWARPDELALIAERGATIAVNTSSNLGLKSGIAPLPEMLKQGCRVAMGLDGMAFDEDDDALREARLAYALHRGWSFDETMTIDQLWGFAARNGPHSVRGVRGAAAADAGRIVVGAPADLVALDWDVVDDEALLPDNDPLAQLLARAHGGHITDVWAAGRHVVAEGRVTGVDAPALQAELLARTRAMLAGSAPHADWRATVQALAQDLAPFYQHGLFSGCCR